MEKKIQTSLAKYECVAKNERNGRSCKGCAFTYSEKEENNWEKIRVLKIDSNLRVKT